MRGPSNIIENLFDPKKQAAWLVLMAALALHVADEAITGFLPFYNDLVLSLRERWGAFPMPTFTFRGWLGGLITGILVGFALTGPVGRGGPLARVLVGMFAFLMCLNGLGHILGSAWFGRILPGFASAWLLLPAAVHMLWRVASEDWPRRPAHGA